MKEKAQPSPQKKAFRLSVARKVLVVFSLCAILPAIAVGIYSIHRAQSQMTEEYRSLAGEDASRVNSILFDITTSTYIGSEAVLSGNEALYLFAADSFDDRSSLYYNHISDAMETLIKNNANLASIHLYTDNPVIPSNTWISKMPADYAGEDWYEEIGSNWNLWTKLTFTNLLHQNYEQLSLIRRIPIATSKYTAYLVIRLDSNNIKNRIGTGSHLICLSLPDDQVFFSTDTAYLGTQIKKPDGYGGENTFSGEAKLNGIDAMAELRVLNAYKTNSQFTTCVYDLSALSNVGNIGTSYLLILLIVCVTAAVIVLLFSFRLSHRITVLKEAMHRARLGDYHIINKFQGNDELQETFQDLKATVDIIQEKDRKYYDEQIAHQMLINRQQQMEFKMLASQINPHFLYNTLETIRMQALAEHNRDVATSIKLLGKSMHYVLENTGTQFTTLEAELQYVDTYLSIQKIRFGERIRYRFETEEGLDVSATPILPLLLQPVVENAVIHGLENSDGGGRLLIRVRHDPAFLYLEVSDDGNGMTPEELSSLREKLKKNDPFATGTSIGLLNIKERIRLCYGEEAAMTIDSAVGAGTTVTLKIPLSTNKNEGGAENGTATDSCTHRG